ncbi:MAG: zinc ribbon domain-containing protein [Leptospirillia bacterium]
MPLYEYTCSACDEAFTLLQSVHTAAGDTMCPACGADDVARQMSVFAPSVPSSGGAPCGPQGGAGCPPMGGGCGSGGGMCGIG